MNKIELGYGVTDRLQLAIEGETKKKSGDSLQYNATEFKAKYKLTGGDYFLKSAIQGKYEISGSGDADSVGLKLNLQKSYGQWDHRANFEMGHEIGEKKESGIDAGMKFGSYYKMDDYKLGGEYYADFDRLKDLSGFDNQEHHIGPVIGFNIPVGQAKIGTKLGYLAGLSDASNDHSIKYEFEYKF